MGENGEVLPEMGGLYRLLWSPCQALYRTKGLTHSSFFLFIAYMGRIVYGGQIRIQVNPNRSLGGEEVKIGRFFKDMLFLKFLFNRNVFEIS